MIADYLILGGGSAGCVLAARLSEDPKKYVILVEAGRDISATNMPDAVRSRYPGRAYLDTRNIWEKLQARMGNFSNRNEHGAFRRYEQAKILGGGSAINALMANRGAPADYDEWQGLGAEGWNWENCLPYFRKLESDRDFSGPLHGHDGPVSIRRINDKRISPFVDRVMQTIDKNGWPIGKDQNGEWCDGTYRGAIAVSDRGERLPTSVAYLTDEVRKRPNLQIMTGFTAVKITFDGRKVIGALIQATGQNTGNTPLTANEVIVAAGAIHSPALLMRSGIGPADHLKSLGIPIIHALSGVGQNLMEHPSIAVAAYLPPSARNKDASEHHEQAIWRYSSNLPDTPSGDMHAAILARSGWHSVGNRIGSLFFWVNKSYSRGSLTLSSADATAEPSVDFRMLSDERDLKRLKDAVRKGAAILLDDNMHHLRGTVFPSSYTPHVARVANPGLWNASQRGTLAIMLDMAGPLRSALIQSVITSGVSIRSLLEEDAALSEFVRKHVGGTWHPAGTCRMGSASDSNAVTDGSGNVYGTQGLRVCDASIMPSIPCANTNIPTIMIAERVSDIIRSRIPS
ncbi:GMC family oxidoreductase N-terminal domain-containing protein [Falsochrobactrum sp. TDYN1]|uniref:GMC family oxidoreductase N-terminal domain-containing protein n=1 Tax=Falsochrobactrum tianjinense TaxID=2706015 RepID=A0A949PU49_9HYPH|nr:GMC family oxidoreductase N-terminal domain-containing protein [Falsochrobactrum sp. TDYN1]MBV2144950.1 GMC family oxidoreductase N-terminal domain-containing protein [Falsochrobactrum sp. TDYN1]